MSNSSSCLVFFSRADITLDDAARRLQRPLDVTRDGDALVVRDRRGGPELVIGLSSVPHVAIEAIEIAERRAMPALGECDRRFEILIADLEATLDETNTLAEVQMTLEDLTDGFVFNSWNGMIQPK